MNNVSVLVSNLPTDPTIVPTLKAVAACRHVYELRDEIVGTIDAESAVEALRRTGAIEKYVKDKEHKATATYAARVLEAAVGAALGPAPDAGDRGQGRNGKSIPREELISPQDRHRFRIMYEHMDCANQRHLCLRRRRIHQRRVGAKGKPRRRKFFCRVLGGLA